MPRGRIKEGVMGNREFFFLSIQSSQHESLAEKTMQRAVFSVCCYFDPHMSERWHPLDPILL
jgi:hypothetical protein